MAALPGILAVREAATSTWSSSGIGPAAISLWAKLSPFPPFSWLHWMVLWVARAPKFYQYYMLYSLGNSLAKWLVPGLYAQVVSGTWLGVLKATNRGAYTAAITQRLQALLQKQAKLRAPKGEAAPQLGRAALESMAEQLKSDDALLDALSSTSTLGIWHRLEKVPLDDPQLIEGTSSDSQVRWVIEALRAGYMGDVETAGRQSVLEAAVLAASRRLRELREEVDKAAFEAQHGALGVGGGSTLGAVQEASTKAAAALAALEEARSRAREEDADRVAWDAKLKDLLKAHAGVPAVTAELRRLADVGGAVRGAARAAA